MAILTITNLNPLKGLSVCYERGEGINDWIEEPSLKIFLLDCFSGRFAELCGLQDAENQTRGTVQVRGTQCAQVQSACQEQFPNVVIPSSCH